MTEEELRDRLHADSVGIMPKKDLIRTLAHQHARRHKRAKVGLIGGSLGATALVVTLLVGLFTGGDPLRIESASPSKDEIVTRVREADQAATTMIMHFVTYQGQSADGTTPPRTESWALRSENRARISSPDRSDKIVRPGYMEEIDHRSRMVKVDDQYRLGDDVVAHVSGSGIGDPKSWLSEGVREVRTDGGDIHLVANRMGVEFELWVDARTYLSKRVVFGDYRMTIDWLPATEENRRLLDHTIPAGFGWTKHVRDTGSPLTPPTT
ncbi:hypothetical protein ALI144C_35265 [Actinosynnema sp. ALI-1.44]|nr:hypothetical protein ALI144C_35265 [Actinosynnema sp. ALI-1.44]